MTTDITELEQMKGQKVEGSYYTAECTDCGKMYPSNKLNGGEPLFLVIMANATARTAMLMMPLLAIVAIPQQ